MATVEQIKPLMTAIDQALEYLNKDLITRPAWGSINFEKAAPDLKRAKSLLDYLKVLPLENFADNAVSTIQGRITELLPVLKAIDNFNIETSAASQRDNLAQQLHGIVDNFYTHASPSVPFLAYLKGDVAENIGKLSAAVEQSRAIIESTKADIEKKG